jgi:hypothetical protein
MGTENHPGEAVELGIPSSTAVYHDGLWSPGSGAMERDLGGTRIHWDRSVAHSITVRTPDGTYAVRAPKEKVGVAELVELVKSLQLAE